MTDTQVNSARKAGVRAFLPAAAWYAVIFAFSAQTGEESGQLSGRIVHGSIDLMGELGALFRTDWDALQLLSFLVRKAAHMGVFFVLTGLLFLGFRRLWTNRKTSMAAAMGLCAVLAALDEFHQLRPRPGRQAVRRAHRHLRRRVLPPLLSGLICHSEGKGGTERADLIR